MQVKFPVFANLSDTEPTYALLLNIFDTSYPGVKQRVCGFALASCAEGKSPKVCSAVAAEPIYVFVFIFSALAVIAMHGCWHSSASRGVHQTLSPWEGPLATQFLRNIWTVS